MPGGPGSCGSVEQEIKNGSLDPEILGKMKGSFRLKLDIIYRQIQAFHRENPAPNAGFRYPFKMCVLAKAYRITFAAAILYS